MRFWPGNDSGRRAVPLGDPLPARRAHTPLEYYHDAHHVRHARLQRCLAGDLVPGVQNVEIGASGIAKRKPGRSRRLSH